MGTWQKLFGLVLNMREVSPVRGTLVSRTLGKLRRLRLGAQGYSHAMMSLRLRMLAPVTWITVSRLFHASALGVGKKPRPPDFEKKIYVWAVFEIGDADRLHIKSI